MTRNELKAYDLELVEALKPERVTISLKKELLKEGKSLGEIMKGQDNFLEN